jgi:hydrogenase maturation protease
MTPEAPGILVIGLGNLVHSDDGVGIHAIHRLQADPRVPPEVRLIDGGTQGLSLIPHISGIARLLVIDAVDIGEKPGTVVRLDGKSLDGLRGKPTVHQLGFADMMIALKLLGDAPEEVVVLGVQPLSTEWSAELTPVVQSALDRLPDLVIAQVEIWGQKSVMEVAL